MRVFIAIDLAPELKREVREFIQGLKKTGAAVKWIEPSAMHLTLKFLGEADPAAVHTIEEEIRRVASQSPGFPLALEGTGCFPSEKRPRILWVGVREEPALKELQASLEKSLALVGYPPEERVFQPHLTIGRVKGTAGLAAAVRELGRGRSRRFGEMAVGKVTFFQSILRPEGAEYRVLAEADLS